MGSPTSVIDAPTVTSRLVRPFIGSLVDVRTASSTVRGTLLSCVRSSAWLVVEDADVLLHLDEIEAIGPSPTPWGS